MISRSTPGVSDAESRAEAVRQWSSAGQPAAASRGCPTDQHGPIAAGDAALHTLNRAIVLLDELLTEQVNAILHHPTFQRLESLWRGARYLVEHAAAEGDRLVKVRLLNVSWRELERDAERATEFDQTALFRKVYEEEFGMAGGEPFGVLIGDYEITHRPTAEHPIDDLSVLRMVSETAAAAFAPFICGLSPSFLGLESFSQLERQPDVAALMQNPEYAQWNSLRQAEDSRFLGLTTPRILMRLPYERTEAVAVRRHCAKCGAEQSRARLTTCESCGIALPPGQAGAVRTHRLGFRFHEDVAGPDRSKYLWGSAAFALGAVLIRTFAQSGWLADIRGFDRNVETGGLVTGLPVHSFGLDVPGVAPKMSTEVALDPMQERVLSDLGWIPLSHCHDTDLSVFFSNRSVHKPVVYGEEAATLNARISAMLQYTFCVSRFAHYLKVQAREHLGSTIATSQLESRLRDWINGYVTPDSLAPADVKAKYPLREAEVNVKDVPGRPGVHQIVMRLWPHYQLDDLLVSLRYVTRLDRNPAAGAT
jgi:predicted component of type VI protein secretion system